MGVQKYLEILALGFVLFIFAMASLVKVFPSLFPSDMTTHMNSEFAQHSTVCITTLFGYQPDPLVYKTVVGIIELCATLGMLFKDIRPLACSILLVVMTGAIQSHICLQQYKEVLLPVLLFMALCYILKITRVGSKDSSDSKKVK